MLPKQSEKSERSLDSGSFNIMKRKFFKYFIFALIISFFSYYFFPEKKLDTSKKIDKITVIKHKRELSVYSKNELLKTYTISLGKEPVGDKQFEGDQKTPEGIYTINNKNPHSSYHLNLGISYPNKEDITYAKQHSKSPGGLIKIHGLKNGCGFIGKFHHWADWTQGCIAVTNKEIEELYYNVQIGTTIEISE